MEHGAEGAALERPLRAVPHIRMEAAVYCHHEPLAIQGPTGTVNSALGVDVHFHSATVSVNVRENGNVLCRQHCQDSIFRVPHAALRKDWEGFSDFRGLRHLPFARTRSAGTQLPHGDMLLVLDGEQSGCVSYAEGGPGNPTHIFEFSNDLGVAKLGHSPLKPQISQDYSIPISPGKAVSWMHRLIQ